MTNPNDLAYPLQFDHETTGKGWFPGLTKREYFAVLATQGIMAGVSGQESLASVHPTSWATIGVEVADALIAALNETKGGTDAET